MKDPPPPSIHCLQHSVQEKFTLESMDTKLCVVYKMQLRDPKSNMKASIWFNAKTSIKYTNHDDSNSFLLHPIFFILTVKDLEWSKKLGSLMTSLQEPFFFSTKSDSQNRKKKPAIKLSLTLTSQFNKTEKQYKITTSRFNH